MWYHICRCPSNDQLGFWRRADVFHIASRISSWHCRSWWQTPMWCRAGSFWNSLIPTPNQYALYTCFWRRFYFSILSSSVCTLNCLVANIGSERLTPPRVSESEPVEITGQGPHQDFFCFGGTKIKALFVDCFCGSLASDPYNLHLRIRFMFQLCHKLAVSQPCGERSRR